MAETSVQTVIELLNEEKWTRATLNSYTINNFKELDELIENIPSDTVELEIRKSCDEHLQHTKNSIIALYISGIISLNRQLLDDSHIVRIISIFSDNHKWKIVEFLCNRILEFGENKFALRTLADCFDHENEEDQRFAVWERLIKVDFEEADIVRLLAEKKELEDDTELAVEYYKKAIHRYINKKAFTSVRDIWHKLVTYVPEETDFFFHAEKKVSKVLNEERASQLLEDLYAAYKQKENWDKCIEILKRILLYDSKNAWARKEIIESYRKKHENHSQLDEYIRLSNLTQSWRNVHDAIADFEKHISFDEGNFVSHRAWGIGLIRSIKDDMVIIDFTRKRGHEMSLKMAVTALGGLGKDHIWVLKSVWPKEKLKDRIKSDIPWALRTLIKGFDNAATMKQIKSELVPTVLSQNEWATWSVEARKVLKTDPMFGNLPDKVDFFVLRDTPISYEEKTFNRFKAEKNFFGRVKIIREFLSHSDPESDFFGEMFQYFTGFLKSYNNVNETVVTSFLLIRKIVREYPFLNPGFTFTFKDLLQQMEDISEIFSKIDDGDLKRDFLEQVKRNTTKWPDIFIALFPYALSRYIIDELANKDFTDHLKKLFSQILDQYKEKREAFIWAAKNVDEESWTSEYDLPYEKVLIGLIHLLDITYREISNRRDVSNNRKINKQIQALLFKEGTLEIYIMKAEEESVTRLFTLVNDINDLDPSLRLELKHKIREKFPDFKFYGEEEKETVSRGLIVTKKSYEEKQKELQYILDVEIPENSKEIGAAIELGDLRENAEYKAGKERQELLNIKAGKLKDELDKATIFDTKDVDIGRISFGTKVTLNNLLNGETETYSFFGPWESDPSRNIISYLSPLGSKLWNHIPGETVNFEINGRENSYKIESIEKGSI